jgi:Uncharacterized protein conserved in bacteria (DUF2330)
MRPLWRWALVGGVMVVLGAGPALACGGLIAPNGTVNLLRTTTLAGYADGVEHYVTSFSFVGRGGAKFGSIVPLPGVPTNVEKGGRWTLQRLLLEVQPPVLEAFAASDALGTKRSAEVLLETQVDALDITVLRGGGDAVGEWARTEGFSLPPDAPEVLDFYAERSPIFMAVRFNSKRARDRDLQQGDGIPVHVTIPTDDPWVPLRILALGKQPEERVEADVFLLTESEPALLPAPDFANTMSLEVSKKASDLLLDDLRSDRGMEWIPSDMWLSYLKIDAGAGDLTHDLAVDAAGTAMPSAIDAGLFGSNPDRLLHLDVPGNATPVWAWMLAALAALGAIVVTNRAVSAGS